ncbi:MAG TPA: hypothetical protein VGF30_13260 [Bacteroidia bacterium]
MKKGSKEMLRTILSQQELIMKALNIPVPAKAVQKKETAKPAKKVVGKPAVKSAAKPAPASKKKSAK